MLVNINDIKVKRRVRKDLGDLEPLKTSLRTYGLLNPITLNSRYELIAGERRLEAAKQLGWSTINAQVLEVADKISQLEIELEENIQRHDFTDEELMAGYTLLEKYRNPGFFRKFFNRITAFFTASGEKSKSAISSKIHHTRKWLLQLPLGIIIATASGILSKKEIITPIFHGFLDIVAIVTIIIGILSAIRLAALKYRYDA